MPNSPHIASYHVIGLLLAAKNILMYFCPTLRQLLSVFSPVKSVIKSSKLSPSRVTTSRGTLGRNYIFLLLLLYFYGQAAVGREPRKVASKLLNF